MMRFEELLSEATKLIENAPKDDDIKFEKIVHRLMWRKIISKNILK